MKLEKMVEDVRSFIVTENGDKILIRKQNNFYMIDAGTSKISDLSSKKIEDWNWERDC